jgi:hypothetical protein
MFQVYVSNASAVSDVCCKCFIQCCICCIGYTHMLQGYVPNVLFVSDICCSKFFMLQVFQQ